MSTGSTGSAPWQNNRRTPWLLPPRDVVQVKSRGCRGGRRYRAQTRREALRRLLETSQDEERKGALATCRNSTLILLSGSTVHPASPPPRSKLWLLLFICHRFPDLHTFSKSSHPQACKRVCQPYWKLSNTVGKPFRIRGETAQRINGRSPVLPGLWPAQDRRPTHRLRGRMRFSVQLNASRHRCNSRRPSSSECRSGRRLARQTVARDRTAAFGTAGFLAQAAQAAMWTLPEELLAPWSLLEPVEEQLVRLAVPTLASEWAAAFRASGPPDSELARAAHAAMRPWILPEKLLVPWSFLEPVEEHLMVPWSLVEPAGLLEPLGEP